MNWKKFFKNIFFIVVYCFAAFGFILTVGFFAVKFHFTDVKGMIDLNDRKFQIIQSSNIFDANKSQDLKNLAVNQCKLIAINKVFPSNAQSIMEAYKQTGSNDLLSQMINALQMRFNNTDLQNEMNLCVNSTNFNQSQLTDAFKNAYEWINSPEWETFKGAIAKDKDMINQVSQQTGIEPRLIVAPVLAEQVRLFNSDREVFKQVFQPLKILGNETQFSLGISGIKEQTAKQIESNIQDQNSPYYLGSKYEHLLDFKTNNPDSERIERLTREHDHYYSYLYAALYIKEIETQWQKAGFDISHRPEIISTLFNIGFNHSEPNANPQVGGAKITVNGIDYTFGSLGYEFYYSGELMEEFPYLPR